MSGDRGDDPGLPVRGRADVERDVPGDQLAAEIGVVDRARAVGDPLRVDGQRPADLGGAAPLAGVDRDVQAALAGDGERGGVQGRVRERLLRPGEVPAGQADRRGPATAASASATLSSGSCERIAVQVRRTSTSCSRAASFAPRATASITVRRGRGRARYGAPGPSGSRGSGRPRPAFVSTSSRGDPLERLRVLHQRDRQVEGAEQLGLVAAGHRARSSSRRIPRDVARRVDARGVRASSSAVSIRSEPSRWRWSSALGIAVSQARRPRCPPGRGAGSWGRLTAPGNRHSSPSQRATTGRHPTPRVRPRTRCYDAARCPGCSTPRHDHPMDACS